jgi:hypothetical protein
MKCTSTLFPALILAGLVAMPVDAGELAKLKPGKKTTSLLAGRLTVKVPDQAKVIARRASIMAAEEATEEETRIVIDAGKERLVIMTWELFSLKGSDFSKRAGKYLKESLPEAERAKAKIEHIMMPKTGPDVYALSPLSHDLKREAIMVLSAVIGHPDGTVQFIAFYVNPKGGADIPGVTKLARSILGTLGAGKRRLDLAAGSRKLPAFKKSLEVQVPKNMAHAVQQGPDFLVHRLSQVAALNDDRGSLGIYIGGHPSFQYKQRENRSMGKWKANVTKKKTKLLGSDVEWHRWDKDGWHTAEAILALPGADRLLVHIFAGGAKASRVDEMIKIAATLKVSE